MMLFQSFQYFSNDLNIFKNFNYISNFLIFKLKVLFYFIINLKELSQFCSNILINIWRSEIRIQKNLKVIQESTYDRQTKIHKMS